MEQHKEEIKEDREIDWAYVMYNFIIVVLKISILRNHHHDLLLSSIVLYISDRSNCAKQLLMRESELKIRPDDYNKSPISAHAGDLHYTSSSLSAGTPPIFGFLR